MRQFPCKGIHDSLGFWIQPNGFRIPGTGCGILFQWNLDSSEFQSPGFGISRAIIFLNSGFLHMGRILHICVNLPTSLIGLPTCLVLWCTVFNEEITN